MSQCTCFGSKALAFVAGGTGIPFSNFKTKRVPDKLSKNILYMLQNG